MNEVIDFAWFMDEGNRALNAGNFPEAANAFTLATIHADSDNEVASAYQMAGVALRLDSKHGEAHVAFETALLYTKDVALRLSITRDEAAVYLNEGKLHRASDLLEDSFIGLINIDETEAGASLGFLARVELRMGHKNEAYRLFISTDVMLSSGDNRTYEMDNLVWLFKVVSPFVRLTLLPRAVRLIRQTGQRRRIVEIVLLTVGGEWLHGQAERMLRRRQAGS